MIHRIYSSLQSFKNLSFKAGLNVVLAEKCPGASEKQTRNSAGKSSLIEIIHFLTGASTDSKSVMRASALEGYSFGMEFDLGDAATTVSRNTTRGSKIEVSGLAGSSVVRELSGVEWVNVLGERMFHLQEKDTGPKPPTFRSLFAYFVRRELSDAFRKPDKQAGMQQDWDSQLALMYLMGFDWLIAREWQDVREREGVLKELKKAAGLGTFGSVIGKSSELRTQLTLAEDRLQRLRNSVNVFQVLEQYRELEKEADRITAELQMLANGNVVDEAIIRDLEASLATEDTPSTLNLKKLYEQANVILPDLVKKRYEDVLSFHNSVVRNRQEYLQGERATIHARIQNRNQQKIAWDTRRSEIMCILQSHGALDEFVKLEGEAGRLGAEVESLRSRFAAAEQLEGTKNELDLERSQLERRLRLDFSEQHERLSDAILAFGAISGRLYETAGSMSIEASRKGPTFEFSTPGNRGTGIQKMQIFCFDMMLMSLCTGRGFGPGFLVHDSRLFEGVDGRQILNALKVGAEFAEELGFQYIVMLNEDDAYKEQEPGFNINDYVLPVRLTDATETGGLFGFRFD